MNMHQGTLYGIFLSDQEYFTCTTSVERILESGDIIFGKRTATHEDECAVVLGFAATKLEAKRKANVYMRMVGQMHKEENLEDLELGETQII